MEISNLSEAEFKTLVTRMLKEPSEDLKSIKKTQAEMKDILIEIKNNLQGSNSRMDEAENQINDLEYKEEKTTTQDNKKKKRIQKKNDDSINSLWDNCKKSNICLRGVPEGAEKVHEIGHPFEKRMKETFPN